MKFKRKREILEEIEKLNRVKDYNEYWINKIFILDVFLITVGVIIFIFCVQNSFPRCITTVLSSILFTVIITLGQANEFTKKAEAAQKVCENLQEELSKISKEL